MNTDANNSRIMTGRDLINRNNMTTALNSERGTGMSSQYLEPAQMSDRDTKQHQNLPAKKVTNNAGFDFSGAGSPRSQLSNKDEELEYV